MKMMTAIWMIGLFLLTASGSLTAETITLNAIEDFPAIEDGEAPVSYTHLTLPTKA